MKNIDDYTIGELKEIIQQREQKDWKEQAKGRFDVYQDGDGSFTTHKYDDLLPIRYKNDSDAELFAKKVDLFNRMNLFAIIHNEGWVADWNNCQQKKIGIAKYASYSIECFYDHNPFVFGISVKSNKIAKSMLEEFKDELEIYLK